MNFGLDPMTCPAISASDLLLEPIDLLTSRGSARFRHLVSDIEGGGRGVPYWVMEGQPIGFTMTDGVCAPLRHERADERLRRFEEFQAGIHDSAKRFEDIDICEVSDEGVLPLARVGVGRGVSS